MRNPGLIAKVVVTMFLFSSASSAMAQAPSGVPSQASFHLLETTITDVHAAFRSGQLTCRQLVRLYLNRIEAYDKAGPRLNAVQTVNPRAIEEAERLDRTYRASGSAGPLHCIPVLVKDQVETSDMPTTYGSAVFQEFVPRRDATVVTKLKQAGAIILGKTTMGEYAAGYTGTAFGIVRNAYDPTRNPSGSSGGTGSGVTANFATVGIGEDTGGSIRGPSAVAGLVGLRPTVPLVSRHGMMPARPTSDTLGPMTRTVRDAALVLDVIAGYDPNDAMTAYAVGHVPPTYTAFLNQDGLRGARIGVIREPMDPTADPASEDYQKVKAVMDSAIADLRRLGATVLDPVTIPEFQDRMKRAYQDNVFEPEQAMDRYLAEHPNAPAKTLREILLTGKVVPRRASQLLNNVGRTTAELGVPRIAAGPRGDETNRTKADGGQRTRRAGLRIVRPPARTDRARCPDQPEHAGPLPAGLEPAPESGARVSGHDGSGGIYHGRVPGRDGNPGATVRRRDAVPAGVFLRAGDAQPEATLNDSGARRRAVGMKNAKIANSYDKQVLHCAQDDQVKWFFQYGQE